MNANEAKAPEILRCSQRDEFIEKKIGEYITQILKSWGEKYYRKQDIIERISSALYYLLTSVSNLQTLGEEYTSILRFRKRQTPSKTVQLLWLILFIGGEPSLDYLLNFLYDKVAESQTLLPDAKNKLLNFISFMKTNKHTFIRLHHVLFYINGGYYNISNRILGIKYVLLRRWLGDTSSSQSFKLLGKVLLFYLLFQLIQQARTHRVEELNVSKEVVSFGNTSEKVCLICSERRKNVTATFCGHLFCWDCIQDSLKYQQVCPICREPLSSSRIIPLQNYR